MLLCEDNRTIGPTRTGVVEALKLGFKVNAGIRSESARRPAQSRPSCKGQLDLRGRWSV